MSLHRLAVCVILMLGVMFVPVRSDAGPLLITGDAEACFGIACTPGDTFSMGSLISYTSSVTADFSGYTDPEDGGLAVNFGTGDFGSIWVGSSSPSTLVNMPFTLLLTFLAPTVSDARFAAQVTGKISTTQSNGILLNFDPNQIQLPYSSATGSGLLDITVFDTAIPSTGMGKITGYIQATTAVPEPATSLLFGTGVLGLLGFRSRKRLRRDKQ